MNIQQKTPTVVVQQQRQQRRQTPEKTTKIPFHGPQQAHRSQIQRC